MRYKSLAEAIRDARKEKGLSQASLAAASETGRVTIARLETGALPDVRLGTLARLCDALGLELQAVPRGTPSPQRLDARRRHAALAAALLALPADKATGLIQQALGNVDSWARERSRGEVHIAGWRARLEGPVRTVALRLLEHGDATDTLLRDSPWQFALEPPAA